MIITLTNTINYSEKQFILAPGQLIEVDIWNVGAFKGTVSLANEQGLRIDHAALIEPYFNESHVDYTVYLESDSFTFKVNKIADITVIEC